MMAWILSLFILALSITTTLQQQDSLPSAPTNVHATVISCAKILVTWSPVSFNGAQLNTYKVYYQKSGSVEKNVDASGTQKTLSRLNSLTTYSISVVAVSGTTEGDRSPVTLNTTFGAVQPTNLQSHNITNISVAISWVIVGPNIGCDGALLESFRTRHKPEFAIRHRRGTVTETAATLNNLIPFTNYTLTVTTMDPSGANAPSDVLTFHTLPGVSSAPVNVTTMADESEPTQLLIMWQEPLKIRGIISHYDVEYMTQGSSLQTVSTNGAVTEIHLTGLEPSALYTIRVRANNYARLDQSTSDTIPGTYANSTSVNMPDPLPVPPGPPRGFIVETNVVYGVQVELIFQWRPPSTGDPVLVYSINCDRSRPDGGKLTMLTYAVSSSATNAKVDARPYTAYDCYIYGTSNFSDGDPSSHVSVAPIPVASPPVRQLSLSPVNYTHVRLNWRRPGNWNNYVMAYNITLKNTATNATREFIVQSTSITIGDLTGNTPYSVDVLAMSVFGNDTFLSNASSVDFITPTGPPSHPRNLTVEAVSHAIVRVHWVPPSPTNGDIIRYEVNVKVRSEYTTDNGQRDYTDSHSTTTNELHYDIPLLTPGSVYSVDVTAHTSEGSGPTTSLDVTLDEGREDAIYYFQLKLKPFTDCTKAQDTDIIQQIKTQLLAGLEEECACLLPDDTITDMKTQCNSDDSHLIYVGRIVGTDTLRPSVMVDLLEEWSRESSSVVSAATTQLNIDQDCPIYLSSPSDPNCVQTGVTTATDPPTTAPVVSNPTPTEDTSDENTNHVPIYTACIVGGFFIGCCLTLLIVVVVFFCRIKRKKKEIEENAIYARPSRRNKRIKVSTKNSINNPVMQPCPAYAMDGDNSDYALPRKRTGSIDSADLQLYRTESKQRVNQLPGTPDCKQVNPPPPPPPTSLPPYDLYDRPKSIYSTPVKQAMSLDALSSYANGHPANNIRKESLYQSPRTPALSVDDLIHGVPKDRFRYSFSPQHIMAAPRRKSHSVDNFLAQSPARVGSPARVATPKGTYDDPRRPSLQVGNGTYDTPRKSYNYTQLTTRPSVADDKDDADYSFVE